MKKTIQIILELTVIIIIAALVIVIYSNPLRRSEESIRQSLLQNTPLGTELGEVHEYILEQDWEIDSICETGGFYDQRTRPAKVTGQKSIRASLGDYHDLFLTNVTVYWGFDEDSKLMDIWVWKTTDAF